MFRSRVFHHRLLFAHVGREMDRHEVGGSAHSQSDRHGWRNSEQRFVHFGDSVYGGRLPRDQFRPHVDAGGGLERHEVDDSADPQPSRDDELGTDWRFVHVNERLHSCWSLLRQPLYRHAGGGMERYEMGDSAHPEPDRRLGSRILRGLVHRNDSVHRCWIRP
jgi:hypothetical protein